MVAPEKMKPGHWYWIRSPRGTMNPYRLHRLLIDEEKRTGEFYVGSMLVTFSLGQVVGEAREPERRGGDAALKRK